MELDINIKKQLSVLLAEPQKASSQDVSMLEDLIRLYPYYQPLHLLLAKANRNNAEENNTLATAALYTNGKLLHQVLFMPERPSLTIQEEEEIFDEIGEIDINDFRETDSHDKKDPLENPISKIETLEDSFVLESISSTDFFAFEEVEEIEPAPAEEAPQQEESNQVSNYHDDSLPYTFLWWLAKTRKEHQAIFQPYASPKKGNPNELQQQYVEHIFHIQSPFNAEEVLNNTPKNAHADPKDAKIIDDFIKHAPQISIPKADQINNENKAKKSAEDHNDLVSETLAKIYIEQMLYHKAIETYEKLSLKFPEKSRYFADLIQSLEKKI